MRWSRIQRRVGTQRAQIILEVDLAEAVLVLRALGNQHRIGLVARGELIDQLVVERQFGHVAAGGLDCIGVFPISAVRVAGSRCRCAAISFR